QDAIAAAVGLLDLTSVARDVQEVPVVEAVVLDPRDGAVPSPGPGEIGEGASGREILVLRAVGPPVEARQAIDLGPMAGAQQAVGDRADDLVADVSPAPCRAGHEADGEKRKRRRREMPPHDVRNQPRSTIRTPPFGSPVSAAWPARSLCSG